MFKSNAGKSKSDVDSTVRAKLASLTPQDTWLYAYAKNVFESRWNLYKTGKWVDPVKPNFPEIDCQSTRFILNCSKERLENFNNELYFIASYSHKYDVIDAKMV